MAKSNFEWLSDKLREISKLGQEVDDGDDTTDYGYHTALKLVTLRYVSDVFSRVAGAEKQKARKFDGAVYVDLFAGTGLVKPGKNNDTIAGSPICAVKGYPYDYSIFVEKGKRRHELLNDRMERVLAKDKFSVVRGDCNDVIDKVIEIINERFTKPIVLVFADPEGIEIEFETLKALGDRFKSCDFVINANVSGVKRAAGQVESNRPLSKKALGRYLGENVSTILSELDKGKSVVEMYSKQMLEILVKPIVESIVIRDERGVEKYVLLCYTRLTRGGSKYRRAWQPLKNKIESLNGDHVQKALDQIHNRSASMDDYTEAPRQSKLTD